MFEGLDGGRQEIEGDGNGRNVGKQLDFPGVALLDDEMRPCFLID
jgi:hypothetical protein